MLDTLAATVLFMIFFQMPSAVRLSNSIPVYNIVTGDNTIYVSFVYYNWFLVCVCMCVLPVGRTARNLCCVT
jgi:hypothetical protein